MTEYCALQASSHLKGGAKKVVISAPSAGVAYALTPSGLAGVSKAMLHLTCASLWAQPSGRGVLRP